MLRINQLANDLHERSKNEGALDTHKKTHKFEYRFWFQADNFKLFVFRTKINM